MVYLIFCHTTSPFLSMVKWCNGEMITDGAATTVRQFCYGIFSIRNFVIGLPGDISWDNILVHLVAQDNSQDANCPGRCPGIEWYFYNLNHTYLIRLYAKGCVNYGMFIYICLQYVPGDCPVISRGIQFIFVTWVKLFYVHHTKQDRSLG